jgi:HEAT repeat protein
MTRVGLQAEAVPILDAAMNDPNDWTRLAAIEVLDRLDDAARPALETLKKALTDKNPYVVRVAAHAVEPFGIQAPKEDAP